MINILLVSVGAAIGAPLRFWLDNYFRGKYRFPLGIMIANVTGSFLVGLFLGANESLVKLFAIGFCGAFTTWSTFVVDTYYGWQNKLYDKTILNFVGSLLLGLAAVKIGVSLA
jgi:CrcB protein